jgi:hypothetical protein
VTYLGTKLPSFRDAYEALGVLTRAALSQKRVERQTERIGEERVAQREAEIEAWSRLPLVQRDQAPAGVKPPALAVVLADGGRMQLDAENPDKKSHWHEYKAGVLQSLASETHAEDPCPEIPACYLERDRIDKLARDITQVAARHEPSGPEAITPPEPATALVRTEDVERAGYDPPKVVERDVVASRRDSRTFGMHLAARAWSLGMFAAPRRAYVGDGQNWLWTEWERHFKPFGFVPILDFIHVLTHVYAAAVAGRPEAEGWSVYRRWIGSIWQGRVADVIAELATRQQELGLPTDEDAETSPRALVSKTLTYLQNQRSRMNYPDYRRRGLPITSAHVESTVKLINRRVKGSEKYWSNRGAEALLQLTSDHLSTSHPLLNFWHTRPHRQTGLRTYAKHAI